MLLRMMKILCPTFVFCMAFSLMLLPTQCLAEEFEIEIAPKVINLPCGSNDFSVHTNIKCGDVDGTICLKIEDAQDCSSENECCAICSERSKCDSRGNFVGKFEAEDVVNSLCLEVGSYRLVMNGTIDGAPFTAAQECEMECDDEDVEDECGIECEELKVIDNANSCASDKNERKERFSSRLRKLIQCMQE